MEDQLKFFPLLSLKEMALRTTAVLLCKDFSPPCSSFNRAVRNHTSPDTVMEKVSRLELPKLLKKRVADAVIHVGLDMRRWKELLYKRLLFRRAFRNFCNAGVSLDKTTLHWTTAGRIDCQKTVKGLHCNAGVSLDKTTLHWTTAGRIDCQKTVKGLHCNAFGVENVYEIACDYCLEDRVALLWEQLPEETKEYFSDENKIYSGLSFQWPHILKGEQSKLDEWCREEHEMNFNQYSFEVSAEMGKKNAAEYFYRKLTLEEREVSVMRSFSKLFEIIDLEDDFDGPMSETFFYLLTLMTPDQQMENLKAHPLHFFFCFFDMIWPDLFLENAPLLWKHLPPEDYARLQQIMVERMEWKGEYSPELLLKFFTQSPPDFMKCFLGSESNNSMACSFLFTCFDLEDSESVKALFRSLSMADRVKLVFHRSILEFFVQCIISDNKWLLVELCVREAALPRGERERLKKHFERALERRGPKCVCQQKLKKLYDFLDAPDASSDDGKRGQKRKLENCSPE